MPSSFSHACAFNSACLFERVNLSAEFNKGRLFIKKRTSFSTTTWIKPQRLDNVHSFVSCVFYFSVFALFIIYFQHACALVCLSEYIYLLMPEFNKGRVFIKKNVRECVIIMNS